MDNTSLAYKEGRYADIFDAARSNRIRKEDVVYYSQSLEKLREYKDGMKRTAEDSWAKGLAEGRAEGRAEGEELERRKGIRMMLAFGIPAEQIADKYGLTTEEVIRIANMS